MVDSSLALALSLAHIERGLNQALSYSIHWPEYAEKLNNHVLRCELLPMNKSIFVFFQHNQISLKSIGPEQVDLTISAPPSALLDMIQKKRTSTAIHIFGNAHLAQILQQAISAVDIDWEGLLADRIGDIPAKQASFIFKKLKGLTQHFMARSLSDTADYLVDEKQLLPSRLEVDAFYEDIHPLHSAVDRLEARIRALEIKHAE